MDHFKLLCILFNLLVCSYVANADWTYPPFQVLEGRQSSGAVNKFIGKIKSDNPQVQDYTLSGEGVTVMVDGELKFRMDKVRDPNTGEVSGDIYLINPLDRETKSSYTLSASAFDASGVKVESDVDLTVQVLDVNDEPPKFDDSSLQGSVPESDGGVNSFMTIKATDADEPGTFNSEVVYQIAPEDQAMFSIDLTSGQVRVVGGLDYEKNPVVTFKVIARDGGAANVNDDRWYKRTAEATVTVTDSNDHAPAFEKEVMQKSLSELSKLNTPLYDFYATDEDEGVNKKVYFDIIRGNDGGTFSIVSVPSDTARSTGRLQLEKPLDFESGNIKYSLIVRAYNEEADPDNKLAFTSTATLNINVNDENEAPIFYDTPYRDSVMEGELPGSGEPRPMSVILKARDRDFNGNQTIKYSVIDPEGWFRVNPNTGEIIQYGAVDREAPAVENGVYILRVTATDNYDHGEPASRAGEVEITIGDINDNAPNPGWGSGGSTVLICEKPINKTVTVIEATDPDSAVNGPKFWFRLDDTVDKTKWAFEEIDDLSVKLVAAFSDYGLSGGPAVENIPFTITDSGSDPQIGTYTMTVSICPCNDDGESTCKEATAAGFPVAIIIAIIAALLLIIILIFAVVAYKRRQAALVLKEPFFDDEDDIRETVQVYQEEGGEEDHEGYDLTALRAPLMEDPNQPVRKEIPLQQAPRQPRGGVPDDIGDYIGEAKDQADADPSAPPFDSLLVFDYEGAGSDAGSLSSINTATTDGSMDYDYLNNWGPRFKKLADMYNDGSDTESI